MKPLLLLLLIIFSAATAGAQSESPVFECVVTQITHKTTEHRVQPGESLSALAKRYYGGLRQFAPIKEANGLWESGDTISAGQVLVIPPMVAVECDSVNRSASCLNRKDSACRNYSLDIPHANWSEFVAWQFEDSNYWELPRRQTLPSLGQVLRARWQDGRFVPLENCGVSTHKMWNWICGGMYCRAGVPTPEGCNQPHTRAVNRLIAKSKARQNVALQLSR